MTSQLSPEFEHYASDGAADFLLGDPRQLLNRTPDPEVVFGSRGLISLVENVRSAEWSPRGRRIEAQSGQVAGVVTREPSAQLPNPICQ